MPDENNAEQDTVKALVIDDEAAIRAMIAAILRGEGYSVQEAQDGRAGFRLFQEHRPELVITDIIMPDQEGIETIRRLRAESPAVIIIAMSGGGFGSNVDFLRMAQEFGAAATLKKPFRKDEVVALVRRLTGKAGGTGH